MLALVGALRYQSSASAPQIHLALLGRGVRISWRNGPYLLERYDELVALMVRGDPPRRARLNAQGRLILAIDGLQPDVGHEILWLIRDVVSGEVLLARRLLFACQGDLATMLREAIAGLEALVVRVGVGSRNGGRDEVTPAGGGGGGGQDASAASAGVAADTGGGEAGLSGGGPTSVRRPRNPFDDKDDVTEPGGVPGRESGAEPVVEAGGEPGATFGTKSGAYDR